MGIEGHVSAGGGESGRLAGDAFGEGPDSFAKIAQNMPSHPHYPPLFGPAKVTLKSRNAARQHAHIERKRCGTG